MSAKRVAVRCNYALGDNVVLSAAVRDLHRTYPGQFKTSIVSAVPDVWLHNPYVQPLADIETTIDCASVELDRRGERAHHYLQAYLDLFNRVLGTNARLSEFRGAVFLSDQERNWYSDIWSLCGREIPFWLIASGGKFDLPVKWWEARRYQEVVDALRGKIQFVQAGAWGDYHPPLDGVIDLRGETTVRDLIHLVYHARGVLCGVTSLMHLAAAVPRNGRERAAIIVAGGREPKSWEAYPDHHFIWTGSAMSCSPCWKGSHDRRIAGDRDPCRNISNGLPLCMDLITADEVVAKFVELEKQGRIEFLRKRHLHSARLARERARTDFDQENLTPLNAPAKAAEFIARIRRYPEGRFQGRGIVICAGGAGYFAQAWVCIQMLREHGCNLPVEVWHYGRTELDGKMERLLRPLGARCVNAREMMKRYPMRNPLGFELKCYAVLHSRFQEIISLDADNVPLCDPETLFDTPEYEETGAIFWPDYGELNRRRAIWKLCGVRYRKEPEFESGQIVLDKCRVWKPLNLAWWYNDHSEFFFRHIYGDKDTFHMAWRRLDVPYSMVPHPIESLDGVMCQHNFQGRRIFQHRNSHKWTFFGMNRRVPGFLKEENCLRHLEALRNVWDGTVNGRKETSRFCGFRFRKGACDEFVFRSVAIHNEYKLPRQFAPEDVILDVGAHVGSFSRACHERGSRSIHAFEPHPENCALARENLKALEGVSLRRAAVLNRAARVRIEPFPRGEFRENTGGAEARPHPRGAVKAVALDAILRRLGTVTLVKLDCEGGEWPILLGSREWRRVKAVCGEFHLASSLAPDKSANELRALLRATLKKHFRYVRTAEDPNNCEFGKFWAADIKQLFPRVFQLRS